MADAAKKEVDVVEKVGSADENISKSDRETAAKYAPELKVIENISESFVLGDSTVAFSNKVANVIRSVGFTTNPSGVITFLLSEEDAKAQEGKYRTAADAHAAHFADAFNSALGTQTPQGMIPIAKNIAHAVGNEVHFDLGALRGFLSDHTVADMLPKIAQQYSTRYIIEETNKNAPQFVNRVIMERQAKKAQQKQTQAMFDKIDELLASDSPQEDILTLQQENPQLAAKISQIIKQAQGLAQTAIKDPEAFEQIKESLSERQLALVEHFKGKIEEHLADGQSEAKDNQEVADTKTASGLFVATGPEAKKFAERVTRLPEGEAEGYSR